jgi:hypothetical protein
MFFTVEGGDLSTTTGPAPSDSTGFSSVTGASIGSSIGIASANNRNTRLKIAISTIGIWGFTESRAVQAAALTRALDCLKGTGLGPNKGVFFILFINIFFPMQIGNWGQIRCFFLLVLSLSSLYFHSQDCCLIAFLGHRSYIPVSWISISHWNWQSLTLFMFFTRIWILMDLSGLNFRRVKLGIEIIFSFYDFSIWQCFS